MFESTVTRNRSATDAAPTTAAVGVSPRETALEVAGLHKSFRAGFWGGIRQPAVMGVDLAVRRGEVFALLGRNGAGKTTTLKAILGLVRPDRGHITISGLDAGDPRSRTKVGYLPESPHFYENLTGDELLDFYGQLLGLDRRRRRQRAEACLERVGMADDGNRRLRDCSKGMRQRIGLAQALLGDPEILILDEPQSGLDPAGRRQVREILLEQKRAGVTVIFSSHIVPDVEAVADRVAVLHEGRVNEVLELADLCRAREFTVRLAKPARRDAVARLLAKTDFVVSADEVAGTSITVGGAGSLASLLTSCEADGLDVLDVQSTGSGLEDRFLRTTAAVREA